MMRGNMNHQEALKLAQVSGVVSGGNYGFPVGFSALSAVQAYLEARADEPGAVIHYDDPWEGITKSAAVHLLEDFGDKE